MDLGRPVDTEYVPCADGTAGGSRFPVRLDPFLLSKYEMTHAQWEALMGAQGNPSTYSPERQRDYNLTRTHPVNTIDALLADEAMRRLDLVLPTSAQWQHAARGGAEAPWWTGFSPQGWDGAENLADVRADSGTPGRALGLGPGAPAAPSEGGRVRSATAFLSRYVVPPLTLLSENTYLSAVRSGMVAIVPLTIIGGLFMVLSYFTAAGWDRFVEPYRALLQLPVTATFGLLALFACLAIGYDLGSRLKQEPSVSAAMATLVFLLIQIRPEDQRLSMDGLGSAGQPPSSASFIRAASCSSVSSIFSSEYWTASSYRLYAFSPC